MKGYSIAIQIMITVVIVMYILWLSHCSDNDSPPYTPQKEQVLSDEHCETQEKIDHLYRYAEFGRLSCGMFHDMMTPLNALIGTIDQLEQCDMKNIAEVKKYLSKSVSHSRKIGTLMTMVRRQVQVDESPTRFCIEDEILQAIELLRYRISQTKTCVLFTPTEHTMLCGNALSFYHIIVNILSNAIDACEQRHGTITLTLTRQCGTVIISVTDTGHGIPRAIQEKLFTSFFTTKGPLRGSGLGLSTTKRAIEKDFNGTITFTSTEHIGTTFFMSFPSALLS